MSGSKEANGNVTRWFFKIWKPLFSPSLSPLIVGLKQTLLPTLLMSQASGSSVALGPRYASGTSPRRRDRSLKRRRVLIYGRSLFARQKTSVQWEVSNKQGERGGGVVIGAEMSHGLTDGLRLSRRFSWTLAFTSNQRWHKSTRKKGKRCEVQLTLVRWQTTTFTFFVVVLRRWSSELRHVTTCWDAGHCTTDKLVFFFVLFFYEHELLMSSGWLEEKKGRCPRSFSQQRETTHW